MIHRFFSKGTADNVIGKRCIVVEKIDNPAGCGEVRINNQVWAARSVNDNIIFNVGERPKVVAIEGVMLVCKK